MVINNLVTVRRQIIIEHTGRYDRKLIDELTLFNDNPESQEEVIIIRDEFLLGLNIEDNEGNILAFHTNDYTKTLFRYWIKNHPNDNETQDLLKSMEREQDKKYVIFVELAKPVQPKRLITLKLAYTDKEQPKDLPSKEKKKYLGYTESHLYTIPRFTLYNRRDESNKYEFFYIIKIPEGYKIRYDLEFREVLKYDNCLQVNERKVDKTELKLHENEFPDIISIRIYAEKHLKLFLNYDVIPVKKRNTVLIHFFLS